MKTLFTILFLFITSLGFSQKWTYATQVGVNYPLEEKRLSDADKTDFRQLFVQLSYQMYLSEDLHQLEPFIRAQFGNRQGFRAGFKFHLNAIPLLTKEKSNIRTLIGLGLVYDTWDKLIDFQTEAKISIRLKGVLIESGATLNIIENSFYGTAPELFVSLGWIF